MTRERIAILSFLVMESLAWYLLAVVLASGAGGDAPAYPTVLLAMVGGFLLTRALQRVDVSATAQIAMGVTISLLTLLVLLNLQYNPGGSPVSLAWLGGFLAEPDRYLAPRWPQTWGVLVVVACWFRAVQVAQWDFSYAQVLTTFSTGLGVFIIAVLFSQSTRAETAINAAALSFFVIGLFTLALIQIRRADGTDRAFIRGPWLGVTVGVVAGLALVSVAIGFFPIDLLYRVLAPVGRLTLAVLDIVILLIAFPIGWLATKLLGLIVGNRTLEFPRPNQVASDTAEQITRQSERGGAAAFFLLIFKFLFLLALAALIAYLLYRVFRRLRRPVGEGDELRESVYQEGSIGADLRALVGGLLGRFSRDGGPREPDLPAGALRVRRLYLRALDRAEASGSARPPATTPIEFSPTLAQSLDMPTPEPLSGRFAAARYGRVEPSAEEIAALERTMR